LPEAERLAMVTDLTRVLDVPPIAADTLFMSWDQVREIVAGGIACQPHTHNHPILTRVDYETVVNELRDSKMQIEQETGQAAFALAYPNGTSADYNADVMKALAELGYEMAFSLLPGPSRALEIQSAPLEIRRIFLGHWDTFEGFVTKVAGVPRLVARA
jgi:peptidoglycan/xylan/chitin deacetylase (PgdA/CDA1 family)